MSYIIRIMQPRAVARFMLALGGLIASFIFLADGFTRNVNAQTTTPPPPLTGVRMQARASFDGHFKYGEWLPIWVELENNGPDRAAELRAPVMTSAGLQVYTVPVELAAGARKRLAIYILPNNFSRQIEVSLVSDEQKLAAQKVQLNPEPTLTYLVGILSPRRGALSLIETIALPGIKRPIVLVDVALNELPGRMEGLRSFDALVFNDIDTSNLIPEQAQALETWVSQGGRLVVGGGAGAQRTLAGIPKSLLPLSDLSTQELSALPGLEGYIGGEKPILIPGPFLVAAGKSDTSRVLAEQDGLPLMQEWPIDRGWSNFISLELAGAPLDAWNGAADFWQKLLSPGASFPEGAPVDMSARQQFASSMVYPLNNLPMLDLPSVRGLALLLGLYILLVGPINYLALRSQKRLHLAWITIPLITLIFSAASFGVGYLLHGTDIFINKIAVLQPLPSGKAKVDSFIGLFSPARSAYSVRVDGGGLISPLNAYFDPWTNPETTNIPTGRAITLIQGNPGYINGLSVDQWSMQSFFSEGSLLDFGEIETDLRLQGARIVGELTNRSNYDLKDAALIMNNRFARLGDLPRGQSASVELELANPSNPNNFGTPISYALYEKEISSANGPLPRQIEVRRSIVEALFERTPPFISARRSLSPNAYISQSPVLIGWMDQAPPEISLANTQPAQQTTALVVLPVNLSFPDKGLISLPPGLISGRLVEMPRDGGQCGTPGSAAVFIVRGEAQFEFALPSDVQDIAAETLILTIFSDSGAFSPPQISILNPDTGAWVNLEGVNQGANLIPNAAKFIDDAGVIKVTLATENASNCFFLGMGLEGRR
jgi:hypothetical protein